VNDKGEVIEGEGEVETTSMTIHSGIHKTTPDAICAFHMHLPYATVLGKYILTYMKCNDNKTSIPRQ
jgi:ribulose-5-phosphate 4-epimerase/fuculose-1-phosphate aldolase